MTKISDSDINPVKNASQNAGDGALGDIENVLNQAERIKTRLEKLGFPLEKIFRQTDPQPMPVTQKEPPRKMIVSAETKPPKSELDGLINTLDLMCTLGKKGDLTLGELAAEFAPLTLSELLSKLKKFKEGKQ